MKTCLNLIAGYLCIILLGTAFGALIIMLYNGATLLVAGAPLVVFSKTAFLRGVLLSFPVALSLSTMLLLFLLIRHSSKSRLAGIITISILTVVSWGVVYPVFIQFWNTKNINQIETVKTKSTLSSNYFREFDSKNFYYTSVDENGFADGFVIYNDVDGEQKLELIKNQKVFQSDDGFSDSLVKNSLIIPRVLSKIFQTYPICEKEAFRAWSNGYLSWLGFASVGLALLFAFVFVDMSSWRLINVCMVCIFTLTIIATNTCCYLGLFNKLEQTLLSWKFIPKLDYLVSIVINLAFVIVLAVLGLISSLTRRKRVVGRE